jgi:hypothetical protein
LSLKVNAGRLTGERDTGARAPRRDTFFALSPRFAIKPEYLLGFRRVQVDGLLDKITMENAMCRSQLNISVDPLLVLLRDLMLGKSLLLLTVNGTSRRVIVSATHLVQMSHDVTVPYGSW